MTQSTTPKVKLVPVTDNRNTITQDGNVRIVEVNKTGSYNAADQYSAEDVRAIMESKRAQFRKTGYRGQIK